MDVFSEVLEGVEGCFESVNQCLPGPRGRGKKKLPGAMVLTQFLRKVQQYFMSDFLHTKTPTVRGEEFWVCPGPQ